MVAKVLETGVKEEVAVFGIVWIDAPMDDFVRWQRDIERLESGEAVEAVKKLGTPPTLADFDTPDALARLLEDVADVGVEAAVRPQEADEGEV